jgi:hypothetical protein
MTTSPDTRSLPPVYFTLRSQPEKGKPVADIELRHGGAVYAAELWAGNSKGKRTLGGTAKPADGRKRLELVFADAEREQVTVSGDGTGEFQNRPGQVLLFFNDKGADLSGYFTVPETGEQLRASVFMEGPSYGTGKLQTEAEYRAALAARASIEGEAPAEPANDPTRAERGPRLVQGD